MSKQPLISAIDASSDLLEMYSGGIFNSNNCGDDLDMTTLLVGYNQQQGYVKSKFSWGSSWGEDGFIRFAIKDGEGECGMNELLFYPVY